MNDAVLVVHHWLTQRERENFLSSHSVRCVRKKLISSIIVNNKHKILTNWQDKDLSRIHHFQFHVSCGTVTLQFNQAYKGWHESVRLQGVYTMKSLEDLT